MLPLWLRQSSASSTNTLLIEVTPSVIVMRRWSQGKLAELGRLDMEAGDQATRSIAFQALFSRIHKRGEGVSLWLSDGQALVKSIILPLAAAENLRQVLGFEMDRHTPFKADQVYFDFRVTTRDTEKSKLTIKLAAVPKHIVDAAIELLTRWGAAPKAVHIADVAVPNSEAINLMPMEHRAAQPSTLLWFNVALLVLSLMLCVIAIGIPILQKREVSIALLPILDRAKTQAAAANALRQEQERLTAEYNFVLDKKKAIVPVVVLLDGVSRLLPDDTWVQQFNLKDKELQIQGETASSSKLITMVENAQFSHNANFRSPLTKGYTPNSERFHIVAEVKPLPPSTFAALAASPASPAGPLGVPKPISEAVTAEAKTVGNGKSTLIKKDAGSVIATHASPENVGIKSVPAPTSVNQVKR